MKSHLHDIIEKAFAHLENEKIQGVDVDIWKVNKHKKPPYQLDYETRTKYSTRVMRYPHKVIARVTEEMYAYVQNIAKQMDTSEAEALRFILVKSMLKGER